MRERERERSTWKMQAKEGKSANDEWKQAPLPTIEHSSSSNCSACQKPYGFLLSIFQSENKPLSHERTEKINLRNLLPYTFWQSSSFSLFSRSVSHSVSFSRWCTKKMACILWEIFVGKYLINAKFVQIFFVVVLICTQTNSLENAKKLRFNLMCSWIRKLAIALRGKIRYSEMSPELSVLNLDRIELTKVKLNDRAVAFHTLKCLQTRNFNLSYAKSEC